MYTRQFKNKFLDNMYLSLRSRYFRLRSFIYSCYQKFRYGVSDEECWGLHHRLSPYILKRLRHFRNMNLHSHPVGITHEEWLEILDQMIFAFDYDINKEKYNPVPAYFGSDFLKSQESSKEEEEQLESWVQKANELAIRQQNGFNLFAKYYVDLWD